MATITEQPRQSDADTGLDVLRDLTRELILAEIEEMNQRERLNRAIRQMTRLGVPNDSIAEATGLRVEEIREISDSQRSFDSLNELLGIE